MDILFKQQIEQFTMNLFTTAGIRDSCTLALTNMPSQAILDTWN